MLSVAVHKDITEYQPKVVGKMTMDNALADERDQIAPRIRTLMQTILDRYKVGVEVVNINLQQGCRAGVGQARRYCVDRPQLP